MVGCIGVVNILFGTLIGHQDHLISKRSVRARKKENASGIVALIALPAKKSFARRTKSEVLLNQVYGHTVQAVHLNYLSSV